MMTDSARTGAVHDQAADRHGAGTGAVHDQAADRHGVGTGARYFNHSWVTTHYALCVLVALLNDMSRMADEQVRDQWWRGLDWEALAYNPLRPTESEAAIALVVADWEMMVDEIETAEE